MLKVRLRRAPRGRSGGPGPDLWIVPVLDQRVPPEFGAIAAAAGFTGRAGQVVALSRPESPVVLVGVGQPRRPLDWERAAAAAVAAWAGRPDAAPATEGALAGTPRRCVLDARRLPPAAATALAAGACLAAWRPADAPRPGDGALQALDLLVDDPEVAEPHWARAEAAVHSALFARDLTATPANRLHPSAFAARLEGLAEHGIAVDVLGRKRLHRLGAGGLLAVGRAAQHGPRLAILRWRGSFAARPLALVGKGLCFDTGGLALKSNPGMRRMGADMAGAAACAGAMLALALRRSPAPVVAVLPLAENAIGADAWRPGDVLRMLSGRTVEVVDTDAEGRIVLADALTHALGRFDPAAVIDLGTLTGAVTVALGHERAGLFGTDAALLAQVAAAGEAVGEPVWPLPIGEQHRRDLDSGIADLRQCATGHGQPDASHAAAFLREFVGTTPWAHLDIAGVAMRGEAWALGPAGATGFGARLLDRLVARHFEDPDR